MQPSPKVLTYPGAKDGVLEQYAHIFKDIKGASVVLDAMCGTASVAMLLSRILGAKMVLSDANRFVIWVLRAIFESGEQVAREYGELRAEYAEAVAKGNAQGKGLDFAEELYYQWRCALSSPAMFIAVNRAGFNGLFRVNQTGGYNVPFGKKEQLVELWSAIGQAHRELQEVVNFYGEPQIHCRTFASMADLVVEPSGRRLIDLGPELLVYFDPPFLGTFSAYTPGGFGIRDRDQMITCAKAFAANGCRVAIADSFCDETLNLYSWLKPHEIAVSRKISCDSSSRNRGSELLATSW